VFTNRPNLCAFRNFPPISIVADDSLPTEYRCPIAPVHCNSPARHPARPILDSSIVVLEIIRFGRTRLPPAAGILFVAAGSNSHALIAKLLLTTPSESPFSSAANARREMSHATTASRTPACRPASQARNPIVRRRSGCLNEVSLCMAVARNSSTPLRICPASFRAEQLHASRFVIHRVHTHRSPKVLKSEYSPCNVQRRSVHGL